MATSDAPFQVEAVALTVRDLPLVARFYEEAIGLEPLAADAAEAALGAGGRTLLRLRSDPHASPAARGEPGLFHTAFLLPSRGDLGAWLAHARANGIRLTGAADHTVSEALYLSDPEGNGIEVYVDRPREAWPRDGERIPMPNDPIDLSALAASAPAPWTGAPEETVVGHVHYRVGSIPDEEAFWRNEIHLALTHRYPEASFLAAGGYHHHVAVNTWSSAGAGRRPEGRLGLAETWFSASRDFLGDLAGAAEPSAAPLRMVSPSGLALGIDLRPE